MQFERHMYAKSNIIVIRSVNSWWIYIPRDVKQLMSKYGFDPREHRLETWITDIKIEGNKMQLQIEISR